MMAINHAMTGALIGATVSEPAAALPLAFASHFLLDAVPHYDPASGSTVSNITSKKFIREQLLLNGALCFLLVVILALSQPKHWIVVAVCAFLGASPDLFWIPRFLHAKRTGTDKAPSNVFLKFHSNIQWLTGPHLLPVELIWLAGSTLLLLLNL